MGLDATGSKLNRRAGIKRFTCSASALCTYGSRLLEAVIYNLMKKNVQIGATLSLISMVIIVALVVEYQRRSRSFNDHSFGFTPDVLSGNESLALGAGNDSIERIELRRAAQAEQEPGPASEVHLQFVDKHGPVSAVQFSLHPASQLGLQDLALPYGSIQKPDYSGISNSAGVSDFVLSTGTYWVSVHSPYFVRGTSTVIHKSAGSAQIVNLGRGVSVWGYVLDGAGSAIGGAKIGVALTPFFSGQDGPDSLSRSNYQISFSDSNGKYEIGGLLPNGAITIGVGARGFGSTSLRYTIANSDYAQIPDVILASEARLTIKLNDDYALLNAKDLLVVRPQREFLLNVERRIAVSDGPVIEVNGLPAGDYSFFLKSLQAAVRETSVTLVEGELLELELYLTPKAKLIGVVLNQDNEAISGAKVWMETNDETYEVQSTDSGQFQIAYRAGAHPRVRVEADGYLPEVIKVGPGLKADELRVYLKRGKELELRISNPQYSNDDSIFNVQLIEQSLSGGMPRFISCSRPLRSGAVRIDGLNQGSIFGLVVESDTGRVGLVECEIGSYEPLVSIEVILKVPESVEGVLLDGKNNPIHGASVTSTHLPWAKKTRMAALIGMKLFSTTTAEDGTFHGNCIAPDSASLKISLSGYVSKRVLVSSNEASFKTIHLIAAKNSKDKDSEIEDSILFDLSLDSGDHP